MIAASTQMTLNTWYDYWINELRKPPAISEATWLSYKSRYNNGIKLKALKYKILNQKAVKERYL